MSLQRPRVGDRERAVLKWSLIMQIDQESFSLLALKVQTISCALLPKQWYTRLLSKGRGQTRMAQLYALVRETIMINR